MCVLGQFNLPISTPRVCDIGEYNFLNVLVIRHLLSIFIWKNNKLETPESIAW